MMDKLEQYIRKNAEAFNDQEIPEGHLMRFEEILRSAQDDRPGNAQDERAGNAQLWGRGVRRIIWAAAGIAAALAAIIFISRPADRHEDWFANVGDDQTEICRAYYEKAGELSYEILANNPDGSLDQSLSSLTEESVPIIDQLPEDMDPAARSALLKEYYGDLLDGLKMMKNIKQ
ncbi:MAG: hypothetical protein IJ205_05180 [Bacteroidales bacterium]|nr:hypothetical protein [Bacteroidales bacterium]